MGEFTERGAAHVCKTQGQFLVDGRILTVTEAKTFVNEAAFAEKTVHFQNPILDAMNMQHTLAIDEDIKAKIKKVRKAAAKITKKPGPDGQVEEDSEEDADANDEAIQKAREERLAAKEAKAEKKKQRLIKKHRKAERIKKREEKLKQKEEKR